MIAERFTEFFKAVNDGFSPYPWQIALAEEIAEMGRWPDAITAPTGSGKSSIVDVHTFVVAERARQLASGEEPSVARPPRRLVLVAPRRVLVDDQFERAVRLAGLLAAERQEGIVGEIADALRGLMTSEESRAEGASPLGVAKLRGGITLDLSWRLDPSRCQVICATPQMWGSRLLMRGYRSSKRARPLETGLLTNDVAVVIDEAHLHQRLVSTARRVSALIPDEMGLQVTAMSATIGGGRGLGDDDFASPSLARRVDAPKHVERIEIDPWNESVVAKALVTQAIALKQAGTVGVFVNTVDRALRVAQELKAAGGNVVVVCGRMRPVDIDRIRTNYKGLLDARGNPDVDYLVSTQSLEVGADLDLPAMVSELAPPSALAQRAGRLNRSGSRTEAKFVVVGPATSSLDPEASGLGKFAPYSERELHAGAAWLGSLGGSISPRRVTESDMPKGSSPPLPILAATDLDTLGATDGELSADIDVDLYIEEHRDEPEREVFVCAREHLDFGDASLAALKAAPPTARELAPIRIGKPIEGLLRAAGDAPVAVLRTSQGETEAFWWSPADRASAEQLRDGDVVVIPAAMKVMTASVIDPLGRTKQDAQRQPIDDVSTEADENGNRTLVIPLTRTEIADCLEADEALATRSSRELLHRALAERELRDASQILKQPLRNVEVSWFERDDESETPNVQGLLVIRQVGSGRLPRTAPEEPVTLADHQREVSERLATIHESIDARDLEIERDQLLAAANHHDAGKVFPSFQGRMGASEGDEPLAKPKPGHRPERGDGWRHEQLSAAYAAVASGFDPVVIALTAAHHGHGRPMFDRDVDALIATWSACPPDVRDAAMRLFGPAGEYEAIRDSVSRRLGIHRLAYFEALLRCADMQVSREGK